MTLKQVLKSFRIFLDFGASRTNERLNQEVKYIDISDLKKTSEMLDEDKYWGLISESLSRSKNIIEQEKILINEISKLSPVEMIGFRLRTDKLLHDTYTSEMWCAGYIMQGGCSDDGFEYFRNWIISRGRKIYYEAKENPDYLVIEVSRERDDYEFESFWYVALEAFNLRTGKQLYDYIDNDNFQLTEGNYPEFEFSWNEDKPETMKEICPKLFDLKWN